MQPWFLPPRTSRTNLDWSNVRSKVGRHMLKPMSKLACYWNNRTWVTFKVNQQPTDSQWARSTVHGPRDLKPPNHRIRPTKNCLLTTRKSSCRGLGRVRAQGTWLIRWVVRHTRWSVPTFRLNFKLSVLAKAYPPALNEIEPKPLDTPSVSTVSAGLNSSCPLRLRTMNRWAVPQTAGMLRYWTTSSLLPRLLSLRLRPSIVGYFTITTTTFRGRHRTIRYGKSSSISRIRSPS